MEARQQERREALDALIEANRVYTPSNRVMQEIEEEARQKRAEKEAARERRAKAAADKEAADKFRSKQESRTRFNSHLVTTREDRTSRLEKQAQFKYVHLHIFLVSYDPSKPSGRIMRKPALETSCRPCGPMRRSDC